MADKIVIKIGTNVLRKDDGSLNREVMRNIIMQISTLVESGAKVILVSSGAMAAGKDVFDLKEMTFNGETEKRQVSSAIGQTYLMREYQDLFHEHGIVVGQVLITKLDLSTRDHYLNLRRCFEGLQAKNVLPIVNENDSTAIEELMFTDNDEIAGMVAGMVAADKLIICTNVDGVFNGNPDEKGSKVLSEIRVGDNVDDIIQAGKSLFGRGGMKTKVRIAQKLAKLGTWVQIINGKKENALMEAINVGGGGTTIVPERIASAKKRWLAFADHTNGQIMVNECLEKTIRGDMAASILPVGIVEVTSPFQKGDLIEIINEQKKKVGVGIAEKSSEVVCNEIGKKNKSIVIHYNHMHIDE